MTVSSYLILAALLPLVGFFLLIFLGRRFPALAAPVATALMIGALGLSIAALVVWVAKDSFNQPHYVEALTYRWLPLPQAPLAASSSELAPLPDSSHLAQGISIGFFIDSLTLAMFVMVTFIASLVHLFSIAYMADDRRHPPAQRYFAYLGLFSFAMLGLILSNSLVQILIFWQIAGLASYLLISFWSDRRGPAMASLKALIVSAIGDAAFVVGVGILLLHVGPAGLTLFDSQGASPLIDALTKSLLVNSSEFLYFTGAGPAAFLGLHWLTWVGLLLFAGAAARAAQFPLHVWLPDAMNAPAPACALLYGSTYIASGVYLVARIYPILTVDAHLVIAIIGCITLLMGALIALVQTNLKHLLAWSTISQLGYMMLFLGAGGYTAGLVHLFTHAFFNACLFLCAASVIHALDHQNDLRQMGGLWRKLPLTALAFLVAMLALIGVPFFSGAYSKMLGLAGVYEYAHVISSPAHARAAMLLFYIPAITCFITAFYMMRCWWLVFAGKSRNEDLAEQAHERFLMVLPIAILALLSLNFYEFFLLPILVSKSIAGLSLGGPPVIRTDHTLDHARQILSLRAGAYATWGFLGAVPAILLYNRGFAFADRLRRLPLVNLLHLWLRENMFFDALYNGVIVKLFLVAAAIAGFLDRFLIDSLANLVAFFTRGVSRLAGNIEQHFVEGGVEGLGQLTRLGAKAAVAPQAGRLRIYLVVMLSCLAAVSAALIAAFYAL